MAKDEKNVKGVVGKILDNLKVKDAKASVSSAKAPEGKKTQGGSR